MNRFLYLLIVFFLVGCAPSRHIIPLARHEKAISVSVGGPTLRKVRNTFPEPLVSLTYAYGKSKNGTRILGLHATAASEGFYIVEYGYLKEWWFNNKRNIGFTTNMVANVGLNKSDMDVSFYPQLDANFYWHYHGDPHYYCDCPSDGKFMKYLYIGLTSYVRAYSKEKFRVPFNNDVLIAPHIGYNLGGKKWKLNAEIKWLQPWANNTDFDYEIWNPAGKLGTFGGYFSIYKFF